MTGVGKSQLQIQIQWVKWTSLAVLVLQQALQSLCMRYTFILQKEGVDAYIPSTAVVLSEVLKLLTAAACCYFVDSGGSLSRLREQCQRDLSNHVDWFKLVIPAILYVFQNSGMYLAVQLMDAATVQVLGQMKVITTALFSVALLSRTLSLSQWLSLFLQMIGVALVQISQQQSGNASLQSNYFWGFVVIFAMCMTSGFAGVYIELLLKSTDVSLWVRNVQLSSIGVVISLCSCYVRDAKAIQEKGFFFGYNEYVFCTILLMAVGGLTVAVVMKYADNILKIFATSFSVVLVSAVSSGIFHDLTLNLAYQVGAGTVLLSLYLYGAKQDGCYTGSSLTGILTTVCPADVCAKLKRRTSNDEERSSLDDEEAISTNNSASTSINKNTSTSTTNTSTDSKYAGNDSELETLMKRDSGPTPDI